MKTKKKNIKLIASAIIISFLPVSVTYAWEAWGVIDYWVGDPWVSYAYCGGYGECDGWCVLNVEVTEVCDWTWDWDCEGLGTYIESDTSDCERVSETRCECNNEITLPF